MKIQQKNHKNQSKIKLNFSHFFRIFATISRFFHRKSRKNASGAGKKNGNRRRGRDWQRTRETRERERGRKKRKKKADRGLSLEAAGSECNPSLTLGPREPRVRHFHPQNGSKEQKKKFQIEKKKKKFKKKKKIQFYSKRTFHIQVKLNYNFSEINFVFVVSDDSTVNAHKLNHVAVTQLTIDYRRSIILLEQQILAQLLTLAIFY